MIDDDLYAIEIPEPEPAIVMLAWEMGLDMSRQFPAALKAALEENRRLRELLGET